MRQLPETEQARWENDGRYSVHLTITDGREHRDYEPNQRGWHRDLGDGGLGTEVESGRFIKDGAEVLVALSSNRGQSGQANEG